MWSRQTNSLTIAADNIARGTRLQQLVVSCVSLETLLSVLPHVPNLTALGVALINGRSSSVTNFTAILEQLKLNQPRLRTLGLHDLDQVLQFVAHDGNRNILEVSLEKDSGITLPYMATFGWSALKHTGLISLRSIGSTPMCGRFNDHTSTTVAIAPLRVTSSPPRLLHNQLMMTIIATLQRGVTLVDTIEIEQRHSGDECACMRTIVRPFPSAAMATRSHSITVASLLDHL